MNFIKKHSMEIKDKFKDKNINIHTRIFGQGLGEYATSLTTMIETSRLKLISRLIEADKRNYWQASDEEIQRLTEAYIDLEGIIEEKNSL